MAKLLHSQKLMQEMKQEASSRRRYYHWMLVILRRKEKRNQSKALSLKICPQQIRFSFLKEVA